MSGLVTFLLFAGFFYLMMRFGCGSHMVHGNHGSHAGHGGHGSPEDQQSHAIEMVKDPVCGMEVASSQGYAKVHEGIWYRLCSRECLEKFDADPQRYMSQIAAMSQIPANTTGGAP